MIFLARFWPAIVGVLLVVGVVYFWKKEVADAFKAGMAAQEQVDKKAFAEAAAAAEELQKIEIARTKEKASAITKEITNALEKDRDDIAGQYRALRLRWAEAEANSSGSAAGGTAASAGSPASFDEQNCSARGWVDFNTAAASAQAADEAIAKDDAWREWWTQQAEAWPQK